MIAGALLDTQLPLTPIITVPQPTKEDLCGYEDEPLVDQLPTWSHMPPVNWRRAVALPTFAQFALPVRRVSNGKISLP